MPLQVAQRSLTPIFSVLFALVGVIGVALSVLSTIDELIGFSGDGKIVVDHWNASISEIWKTLSLPLPDAMLPSLTLSAFVLILAFAGNGLPLLDGGRRLPGWLNPFIALMAVVAFAHFVAIRRHTLFTIEDRIQGYFFLLGLAPSGLSYFILPHQRLHMLVWIVIVISAGFSAVQWL